MVDPRCPYCEVVISPAPQRKRKCPSCKKTIFVKYRPTDPQKRVVTEEQATEIDKEWDVRAEQNKFDRALTLYGASRADADGARILLFNRQGQEPSARDIIWEVAEARFRVVAAVNDYHAMKMIRFSQALLLFDEGGEHLELKRESVRYELLGLQTSIGPAVRVSILTAGDASCSACRKLELARIPWTPVSERFARIA